MAGEIQINDLVSLVLGTSGMLVMLMAIIAFAFLFQRKLIKKERAYREIEKLLQKQELKSAYAIIEGQEDERRRIASDIHDNMGSMLATLKIYSDLIVGQPQDIEMKRLNTKINEIAETLTDEVRKISHSLDASTLKNFGLQAAIEQLCEAIRDSGKVQVVSFIDLNNQVDGETSLHIYRIVQELFTNTLKHANASSVRSEITQTKDYLSIIHQDNGIGFDTAAPQSDSMGLQNIRSRVGKLNGEFKIQSSSDGSTFIIEIPLKHGNGN